MSGRASDEADFTAFLSARADELLRTAFLLTGDRAEAEEVQLDALARLRLEWGEIAEHESPDAAAQALLVHAAGTLPRRLRRRMPDAAGSGEADAAPGEGDRMWAALQRLPLGTRAVAVLQWYEQLPAGDVAEVLGVSDGTVTARSARAVAAVAHALGEAPHTVPGGPGRWEPGRLLRQELARRAATVESSPLVAGGPLPSAVRRRSDALHRRQRWRVGLTAGALAAAVTAVALPVVLSVSAEVDRTEPEPVIPTMVVDIGGPDVPYLFAGVLYLPDGTSRVLPELPGRVTDFAELVGGRFVFATTSESEVTRVTLITGNGLVESWPSSGGIVVGEDGWAVAWVAPDGTGRVLSSGNEPPVELARAPGTDHSPVALLGRSCGPTSAEGCRLVVNSHAEDGSRVANVVTSWGFIDSFAPGLQGVDSVAHDQDLAAGPSATGGFTCSGVYSLVESAMLWESCRYRALRFSPDGSRVAAYPGSGVTGDADDDGPPPTTAYIVAVGAPDDPAVSVRTERVSDVAWEGRDALLVGTVQDGQATLLRLTVGGVRTKLAGPLTVVSEGGGIVLPADEP